MAFASVIASTGGNAGSSTTHTLNRPVGHQAGDLVLYIVNFPYGTSVTDWNGLTKERNVYDTTPRNVDGYVAYEVLSGSEPDTVTITTFETRTHCHSSYLIRNHNSAVESAPAADGEQDLTSASPDPPSLTPSWGAADTLWFAVTAYADGTTTVTGYPSGFTSGRNDRYAVSAGVGVGAAYLALNAASVNPGTFGLSASEEHVVCTIAIEPGAGGPTAGGDPTLDGPPTDVSVFLEWTDSPDNLGCYAHRSPTPDFTPSESTRIPFSWDDLGADATSFTDTTFPLVATDYYYVIEWTDAAGSTYSNELTARACYLRPSDIIWGAVTATTIAFSFTVGTGSSAAHHQIFVYEDGVYLRTVMLEPGTNSAVVAGLKPGSLYSFKIQAYDATFNSGIGAFSTLYSETKRTDLRAIVTAFELEVPLTVVRQAIVTAFELETEVAGRTAVVSAFELETEVAGRAAHVTAFELETPDFDKRAVVTAFELETEAATVARQALVTAFELETEVAGRQALVSAFELEAPSDTAPRQAMVTAFELETGSGGRYVVVSAFELAVSPVERTTSQPGHVALPPFPSPGESYIQGDEAEFRRQVEEGFVDVSRVTQDVYENLSSPLSPVAFDVRNFGAVGDGVTDDAWAIQATIDAAPDYSEIILPGGFTFAIGAAGLLLSSRNGLVLTGGGVVRLLASTSQTLPDGGNTVGIKFISSTNCGISNLHIDGNDIVTMPIGIAACTDSYIDNCEVFNFGTKPGIYTINNDRLRVSNNYVHAGGTAAQGVWLGNYAANSLERDVLVYGNTVIDLSATAIVLASTGGRCFGNLAGAEGGVGSGIIFGGGNGYASSGLSIIGNYCIGSHGHGIQSDVYSYSTDADIPTDIVIANNVCRENDGSGIFAVNIAEAVISGNVCIDNNFDDVDDAYGIQLGQRVYGCVVANNICYDSRSGASRTQVTGILSGPQGDTGVQRNLVISNNVCRNHLSYGIELTEASGAATIDQCSVHGNTCIDNSSRGITLSAATQAQFSNLSVVGNVCFGNTQYDLDVSVDDAVISSNAYTSENNLVKTLDDTGTPSVKGRNLFKTGGTTAITDFDDGVIGQTIKLIAKHSVTITDGAPIVLNGSGNFTMVSSDTLTLTMFDSQVWQEVARSVN